MIIWVKNALYWLFCPITYCVFKIIYLFDPWKTFHCRSNLKWKTPKSHFLNSNCVYNTIVSIIQGMLLTVWAFLPDNQVYFLKYFHKGQNVICMIGAIWEKIIFGGGAFWQTVLHFLANSQLWFWSKSAAKYHDPKVQQMFKPPRNIEYFFNPQKFDYYLKTQIKDQTFFQFCLPIMKCDFDPKRYYKFTRHPSPKSIFFSKCANNIEHFLMFFADNQVWFWF